MVTFSITWEGRRNVLDFWNDLDFWNWMHPQSWLTIENASAVMVNHWEVSFQKLLRLPRLHPVFEPNKLSVSWLSRIHFPESTFVEQECFAKSFFFSLSIFTLFSFLSFFGELRSLANNLPIEQVCTKLTPLWLSMVDIVFSVEGIPFK